MIKQLVSGVKLRLLTIIVGISSTLGIAHSSAATLLNFDLTQNGTGTLPHSATYTISSGSNAYSVTFSAFKNNGNSDTLQYKSTGSNGTGLLPGTGSGYVLLSTAGLSVNDSSVILSMGKAGGWQMYASTSTGTIGTLLIDTTSGLSSVDLLANNYLQYGYLIINTNNIPLTGLSVNAVPEPSTMATLLIGMSILIPSLLKLRKKNFAQKHSF